MKPTILVIFGVTGDLSKRKLMPAIEQIVKAGEAPRDFKVVGVTRQHVAVEEVLQGCAGKTPFLEHNLDIHQMDLSSAEAYRKLAENLKSAAAQLGGHTQVLFYLSVPPQMSQPIIEQLGQAGFGSWADTKLLLEKPFGTNLDSAQELITQIKAHFREEQIYRIDHYLAKEMTQNIVVFRQSNSLFKQTWNRDFIESIEIIASESIGIEGRSAFYEQTGALRDLIQSHLLQLAALTLADFKQESDATIPSARLKALRSLIPPQDIHTETIHGQYEGYRQETGNSDSLVETFAALTFRSRDPNWEGVPITLITGKALDKKATEIRLRYRQEHANEANALILRIQPDEGVEVDMWVKKPGFKNTLQKLPLTFAYSTHFEELPEAYERVFVDAMRSDHSLFTTSDEVLETWRLIDPVQKAWEMHPDDLVTYKPGSKPEEIG